MKFFKMPFLGGNYFSNAARQFPIRRAFWINAGCDSSAIFLHDHDLATGGGLIETIFQLTHIDAANPNKERAGSSRLLLQFTRRAVSDDLAAIDDNGAGASGF